MDKILVIDDIQQNVELMVAYLRNAGYDVMTANDGMTGIKVARLFKPDLIILDLIMPKMSGFDVCKTLKNDETTQNMIILVVTAMDSKETRTRAFEVGADEYMEKTFDKGIFLAKVKSLLRVKSLSDKLKENYAVLEEQNKQFAMQLEMAEHVQSALVREVNFSYNDISFVSCYRPAQGVSGDLYDIVTLKDDCISVFISDVSGHGISAALLTSMLKIMFRNLVNANKEPDKLLQQMNEEFCNIFSGSSVMIYACAFYAQIDVKNKQIKYSNAGGALPLFLDNSKRTVTELDLSGKPLGMMDDSIYMTKSIPYDKDDMLFFQTDGLADSLYKEDPEQFVKKLSDLLLDVTDKVDPVPLEEVIDYVLNQFYNMSESAKHENDDVTFIICNFE